MDDTMNPSAMSRVLRNPQLVVAIGEALCPHCVYGGKRGPWFDANIPPQFELHHRSQPALANLAMTCRQLRKLLQPVLFHSFCPSRPDETRLLSLLRALVARPDLARCMKSVALSFAEIPVDREPTSALFQEFVPKLLLSQADQEYLLGPRHPLRRFYHWLNTKRHENINSITQLVLLHIPNLEFLQIEVPGGQTFNWSGIIGGMEAKPRFPRLKYLVLGQLSGGGTNPQLTHQLLNQPATFLHFRSIKSFLQHTPAVEELWITSSPVTLEGLKFDFGLENLRRLEFTRGLYIPPEHLDSLLSRCTRLESLSLYWDPCRYHHRGVRRGFMPPGWHKAFWAAIEHTAPTLQELTLDIFGTPYNDPGDTRSTRTTLRDFRRLRKLKLGNAALTALRDTFLVQNPGIEDDDPAFIMQLLPPSIAEVTLWGPTYSSYHLGVGFLTREMRQERQARERYPDLSKLVIAPHCRDWCRNSFPKDCNSFPKEMPWPTVDDSEFEGKRVNADLRNAPPAPMYEVQQINKEYWGSQIFGLPLWPHNAVEHTMDPIYPPWIHTLMTGRVASTTL
ncbi:hypothetical protein QBC47DRAFT_398668 [Echria macrotheca]|uniref:Uncharacterized protein n=1 Tax=Echria macrotheca TaxID=438768 RepID=A0AAJ0FA92_9PEZI|nr:hypothetical protein QBC47DRAFT_398668 [Echria macrotheca]